MSLIFRPTIAPGARKVRPAFVHPGVTITQVSKSSNLPPATINNGVETSTTTTNKRQKVAVGDGQAVVGDDKDGAAATDSKENRRNGQRNNDGAVVDNACTVRSDEPNLAEVLHAQKNAELEGARAGKQQDRRIDHNDNIETSCAVSRKSKKRRREAAEKRELTALLQQARKFVSSEKGSALDDSLASLKERIDNAEHQNGKPGAKIDARTTSGIEFQSVTDAFETLRTALPLYESGQLLLDSFLASSTREIDGKPNTNKQLPKLLPNLIKHIIEYLSTAVAVLSPPRAETRTSSRMAVPLSNGRTSAAAEELRGKNSNINYKGRATVLGDNVNHAQKLLTLLQTSLKRKPWKKLGRPYFHFVRDLDELYFDSLTALAADKPGERPETALSNRQPHELYDAVVQNSSKIQAVFAGHPLIQATRWEEAQQEETADDLLPTSSSSLWNPLLQFFRARTAEFLHYRAQVKDDLVPALVELHANVTRDWAARLYAFAVPTENVLTSLRETVLAKEKENQHDNLEGRTVPTTFIEVGAGLGYWAEFLRRGLLDMESAKNKSPSSGGSSPSHSHKISVRAFDVMPYRGWRVFDDQEDKTNSARGSSASARDVEPCKEDFSEAGPLRELLDRRSCGRASSGKIEHSAITGRSAAGVDEGTNKAKAMKRLKKRKMDDKAVAPGAGVDESAVASSLNEHRTCLFLCFPPPSEPMAANCLQKFNGRWVVYVGEWATGMTADWKFHATLLKEFSLRKIVPLPAQWATTCHSMFIFERKTEEIESGRGVHLNIAEPESSLEATRTAPATTSTTNPFVTCLSAKHLDETSFERPESLWHCGACGAKTGRRKPLVRCIGGNRGLVACSYGSSSCRDAVLARDAVFSSAYFAFDPAAVFLRPTQHGSTSSVAGTTNKQDGAQENENIEEDHEDQEEAHDENGFFGSGRAEGHNDSVGATRTKAFRWEPLTFATFNDEEKWHALARATPQA
ncbi:unnamed protein product [Amoebophrya sp. A120]|nr:unnamed protein product [Amoebophrya sp. A120]|eukprot:GSA120T00012871001.1